VTIIVNNGAAITNTSGDTNTLGLVNLSGGTITATSGTGNSSFQSYVLNDTITVTGSNQSTITTAGATNAGCHLGVGTGRNVTFNVDPSKTGASLVVSAPLIGGSGTAGGAAGSTMTKTGYGVMTLSDSDTYSGGTIVNSGVLIAADGLASVGSGNLTVNGGSVIFRNTSAANVNTLLKSGYNGGTWTGNGIDSTANDPAHLHAVGMLQPSSATTFESQTLGTGDVAVKYTYYGDANLDGKVDGTDYSRIDNGYLLHLTGWYNGDFNYDNVVNGSDYTLIDNAYNMQGVALSADIAAAPATAQIVGTSAVPEPATLALFGLAAMSQLARRRRYTRVASRVTPPTAQPKNPRF
jgi:autotransporter-associated beta strand protein